MASDIAKIPSPPKKLKMSGDGNDDTGEETDSDVEEYSCMEQPPLIKQLKTILAEYPDDGQIIKELVQNAEDAGATEMKILYDGRRINTEVARKIPYRKFFKGPALCFHNNAMFSDKDWRGIKMIYSSVKEEDPLKVGRFGLGFKSVFHITDHVCIVSGRKILLMNPHERVPDKVCITVELAKLRKCRRLKIPDLLSSLSGMFGFSEQTLDSGHYDGTIFWFPLRETKSELSDTVYTRSEVLDLFKSFQSEATKALLFLKNLSKVELLCKASQSDYDLSAGQPFFSVEIQDEQSLVKRERQGFLQNIKNCNGSIPESDITSISQVCFKTLYRTTDAENVDEKDTFWLVVNMFKGGQMSQKMTTLVNDKNLSYSPYVGVAVPLDGARRNFKGHIFCFLPLPQENKSLTGLPVHVNGFFALSQNRRHLKWASADQEALNMHRDKSIEWNECLVAELLPQAYVKLMDELIYMSKNSEGSLEIVETLYSCIPDVNVIESNWEPLVRNLAPLLLKKDFVFVPSKKWLQPNQPLYIMFDQQEVSKDIQNCVRKTLRAYTDVDNTAVPDHVWEFIKKFFAPRDISPNEFSRILKSGDHYMQNLTREDKMKTLEYLLLKKDFALIEGLELLPLDSGAFVKFQQEHSGTSPVFLCSSQEVELFPGLENRFSATKLPTHQTQLVEHICSSAKFQLQVLTTSDAANLLRETIQLNFGTTEYVRLRLSEECKIFQPWVEKIWKYILANCSSKLSSVCHLPLLPSLVAGSWEDDTWKTGEIHLYKMTNIFILKSAPGMSQLPEGVCRGLEHLSVKILESLPPWIDATKLSCIFYPTQQSVLQLFDRLDESDRPTLIETFNSTCQAKDRVALVDFLAVPSDQVLSSSQQTLLRKLDLFQEKSSTSDIAAKYVSLSTRSRLASFKLSFPVKFPKPLLILTSLHSKTLALNLGVTEVNEEQMVREVLQVINKSTIYSDGERQTFMKWFLQNIDKFKVNADILELARSVPFVSNGTELCHPFDLFDPQDLLIASLFCGETKFPVDDCASDPFVQPLRLLGLKTKEDVSAVDILETARLLDKWSKKEHRMQAVFRKAHALLQVLEEHPDILATSMLETGCQLHSSVSALYCIPHQRDCGNIYPSVLPWKGSEFLLCNPAQLKNLEFASITGSVLPLIKFSSKRLGQYFQWDTEPSATDLIRQLKCIIEVYKTENKPVLLNFIFSVYKAMADRTTEIISDLEFQNLSTWVWREDGFCPPAQIVLNKKEDDINLEPYIYHLPKEFQHMQQFFNKSGCHETQSVSVLLSVQELMLHKHKDGQIKDELQVRKDLNLTMQILKKLFHERDSLGEKEGSVLFPVHTEEDTALIFKPANQCTFCDSQWLRDDTEGDEEEGDEEEDSITFVHSEVPCHIAEGLGVKSLRQNLMSDMEGLEEWGQEEPLTRRLHNLLREGYVDGLSVPKEIIQNADDAGAKEVCFLYDERENLDARTHLLDEGMSEFQGPALWCYNSALFSEDDLRNITRLSGATKEMESGKIGKFGLGFCAVYNLTDVPSFISGKDVVIFDPHTSYLGKALLGKSPGIRISLLKKKNSRMMKRLKNQFKPFQGVFGCDLLGPDDRSYFQGTLFRLPLRTLQQSAISKIKNMSYSREEIIGLLKQFVEASGNMLLFTQNLEKIEVYHIPNTGCTPDEALLLFSVQKNISKEGAESVLKYCSVLKAQSMLQTQPLNVFQTCDLTLTCTDAAEILGEKPRQRKTSWLLSWATGTERSLQLTYSTTIKGALPLGGIAMFFELKQNQILPRTLTEVPFGFYNRGHLFCYLPLPVQSSLGVHVNGSFAVTSDRRSLRTNTEDDKYAYDTQWNEALLGDAVVHAFVNLLESLPQSEILFQKALSSNYSFYSFWPTSSNVIMATFTKTFYQTIVNNNHAVFESCGKWKCLQHCMFLDEDLAYHPELGHLCLKTLRKFSPQTDFLVVDLPAKYFDELKRTEGWKKRSNVLPKEKFFENIFLPNVGDDYWLESEDQRENRKNLLLHCLDMRSCLVDEKMKLTDCIPVLPDGVLRRPSELVHPECPIACLFGMEDGRFPSKDFWQYNLLKRLAGLGMMEDKMPADLVTDRANTVPLLASSGRYQKALERCRKLVDYLVIDNKLQQDTIEELQQISFLPVMPKPVTWPFTWKAEARRNDVCAFERPNALFLSECQELVACEEYIIDTKEWVAKEFTKDILSKLGVKCKKAVKAETVIRQLLTISKEAGTISNRNHEKVTDDVCLSIYEYLEKELADQNLTYLREERIVKVDNKFLLPKQVVLIRRALDIDVEPYMYHLPKELHHLQQFFRQVGCQHIQDISVYLSVQEMMLEKYRGGQMYKANEVRKDLNMTIQILTKLNREKGTIAGKEKYVLFPAHTEDERKLILKPASQCLFCDTEWLKDITEAEEDEENLTYVHCEVSNHIAEGLGVKSLRQHLISEAEGLEEWGQEEPLTRRLHNLLKDGYTDGLSVPKELIQNADDAGAKEICFLYDERENLDKRSHLLDESMADCQGPALWCYNSAVFSEDDLRNITKLSGATKETDTTKIGKFGLGFCAVYNLTDVPSFISGHDMVIFDPHMTYLGKVLPGRSPGIRIGLHNKKNTRMMKRHKNQFKPFQDVFGCDLSLSNEDPYFNGTLFRFPLRTHLQSETSKIKKMSYSRKEMIKLLKQFVEASGNMLLFTQSLEKIEVYHIPRTGCTPSESVLLWSVQKGISNEGAQSVLKSCSELSAQHLLDSKPLTICHMCNLTLTCTDAVVILKIKAGVWKASWLLSWATGTSRSVQLTYSTTIKGALPLGSIAMLLSIEQNGILPTRLQEAPFGFYNKGHLFCYLPLPVQSSLDVHINGSFAVTSDRRSLRTNTEDDKYAYDTQWNEALLGDAVVRAFISLLENLPKSEILFQKALSPDYSFYSFWPTVTDARMTSFTKAFYQTVVKNNCTVFESCGMWKGLQNCIFLDGELAYHPEIGHLCLNTLRKFNPQTDCLVVDLPAKYYEELQRTDKWKERSHVLPKEEFFESIFLPNVGDDYWLESEDQRENRKKLLLHCLNMRSSLVDEKMKTTDCIPTHTGEKLNKPKELVHPHCLVASLFLPEEGRFPEKTFGNESTWNRLVELGMMKDRMPSDLIIDRAKTVPLFTASGSYQKALKRCTNFIRYLISDTSLQQNTIGELQQIPFLPVMGKPATWPFTWKGENGQGCLHEFERPKSLFFPDCKELIACEELILDGGEFSNEKAVCGIMLKLGVKSVKCVRTETVIKQLLTVSKESEEIKQRYEQTTGMVCSFLYKYLDKIAVHHPDSTVPMLRALQDQPIIYLGNTFLYPRQVAFTMAHDCAPELFGLDRQQIARHKSFLKAVGVKDKFELGDIAGVMKRKRTEYLDTVLPLKVFDLVCHLLLSLTHAMVQDNKIYDDLKMFGVENIVAPDIDMILRPTCMLCFDDCSHVQTSSTMVFVHPSVSREAAEKLGVLTKRSKDFKENTEEIVAFEQREELVTRLHSLLDGYPCDAGIMKELIQNADDAGATEIHFIKDFRTHGCKRIFDEKYTDFQGPALCVFNNSSFSQEDLKGIQRLGRGSKTEDPAKTGQYGVGFNAVYNLTDTPSFLTKGPEIEGGETLCYFDPLNKTSKGTMGTRFKNLERSRRSYPDVFEAYSEQVLFAGDQGTVFRFPLRRAKSSISDNVITTAKLEAIFRIFSTEMFKMMFFLKRITKITLSDISSGQLRTEYAVSVSLSEQDSRKRVEYFSYCSQVASAFKKNKLSILAAKPMEAGYNLLVSDSLGREQQWHIVQRIGFVTRASDNIQKAVRDGNLGLLPHGGVAVQIPKRQCQSTLSKHDVKSGYVSVQRSVGNVQGPRKPDVMRQPSLTISPRYSAGNSTVAQEYQEHWAYCFLPLPTKTGLPMHINGHFVLDHEARRGLWKEEEGGFKSDWNHLLLSDVVSKAYVAAFKFIQLKLFGKSDSGTTVAKTWMEATVKILDDFFPIARNVTDPYWKYLVMSVFHTMIKFEEKVFPLVLEHEGILDKGKLDGPSCHVTWSSFHPQGHSFPVYFVDVGGETGQDAPIDLLKAIGLKITSSSLSVQQSLEDVKFKGNTLSPRIAIEFLKSHVSHGVDNVQLGALPCPLKRTKIRTVQNLGHLLLYCSIDDDIGNELKHLPLLVTNDGILRCFSSHERVYCTKYCSLLQNSPQRFVHRNLVRTMTMKMKAKAQQVIDDLHLADFVEMMHLELDVHQYSLQDCVKWEPHSEKIPNWAWIKDLWQFVLDDFNTRDHNFHPKFATHLLPLQNWCLVPVKTEVGQYLVKIEKAYSILNIATFVSRPQMEAALRKTQIYHFDVAWVPYQIVPHLSSIIASTDDPVLLLTCLWYHRDAFRNVNLKHVDCNAILSYFSDNLSSMSQNTQDWWIHEKVRALPLFITYQGTLVSLENQQLQTLVLPKGIPVDGLDVWAENTGTVLLRSEYKVKELHKFLGFSYTEEIDVYMEHILKTWNLLPTEAIIFHLKFMRDTLLRQSLKRNLLTLKQNALIEKLSNLPVIPDKNTRKRAKDYFSPYNEVFKEMCKKDDFPPQIFCEQEWQWFLTLIGMKTEVTGPMFVQFAMEVEAEGRVAFSERKAHKSQVLVKYLLSGTQNWGDYGNIYSAVSSIKFVVIHRVKKNYSELHPQCGESSSMVCFANSISYRHENLCWTSLPLLPDWADSRNYWQNGCEVNQKKEKLLHIHQHPPLDSVITHCQNICGSLKRSLEDSTKKDSICRWVEPVMETLYEYLQSNRTGNDEIKQKLCHTSVVYIPDSKTAVPAHRVVEHILPEQEIRPYLFVMPTRFGKFCSLFKYLGASDRPSFLLYVKVLALVKEEIKERELDGTCMSALLAVKSAMENLFRCLQSVNRNKSSLKPTCPGDTQLYLPSRRRKLVNVSDLVVSNNRYLERRLHGAGNLQFFLGFTELELSYNYDAIFLLPTAIRPKLLTKVTKEEIDTTEMVEIDTPSCLAIELENFLQSNEFVHGMLRLLKHTRTEKQEEFSAEEATKVSEQLQNVEVRQVTGLKTYLYLNGERIDDSAEEKHCFIPKLYDRNDTGHWRIYFMKGSETRREWFKGIEEYLLKYINYVTEGHVDGKSISDVLNCIEEVDGISLMLDRMRIDPYDLPQDISKSVFPAPGTYVPVKLHHLLNCDFTDIGVHEYRCVALELEDASLQDDIDLPPVYIYVQIKKKVPTDGDCLVINQKYEIFTGEEDIVVSAFKIYKFIEPSKANANKALDDAAHMQQPNYDQPLSQVFSNIRHILRAVWNLPEEDRKQVIKRLCLRWHPDESIGNEYYDKVSKYIKEVIWKLEKGIPLDDEDQDDDERQPVTYDGTSSTYSKLYERMDRRNRFHQSQRRDFYSCGGTTCRGDQGGSNSSQGGAYHGVGHWGGSYISHGRGAYHGCVIPESIHEAASQEPYNDMGEAERWQSQAKVDLRTALQSIDLPGDPPAYNWTCYKCHQAAEKSLKAAHFAKNANKVPKLSHNLMDISRSVLGDKLYGLATCLTQLLGDHTKMRYPDKLQRPKIPSTIYTREHAQRACELASQILETVKQQFLE